MRVLTANPSRVGTNQGSSARRCQPAESALDETVCDTEYFAPALMIHTEVYSHGRHGMRNNGQALRAGDLGHLLRRRVTGVRLVAAGIVARRAGVIPAVDPGICSRRPCGTGGGGSRPPVQAYFNKVYRQHRPMVERSIAWLTRRNRRVRYHGATKNDHWLHLRVAGSTCAGCSTSDSPAPMRTAPSPRVSHRPRVHPPPAAAPRPSAAAKS
jgi:hypothetical protein